MDLLRRRFRGHARREARFRSRKRAEPRQDLSAVGIVILSAATDLPRSYAVDGLVPGTIERPATPEAIPALLKSAAAGKQSVIPWGAGTKQTLGNVPRAYDLALALTALDQIVEYEPADLVVTAQAGIPLATLQAALKESGQFLALDPPYAGGATLGGTLAANFSGPSRLLYGTARDLVLGLRVALPNGELVKSGGKVVKNVVGYDLNKMHIGALGTLGVIVEVTLKVHPLPAAEATIAASFGSLPAAAEAASRICRSVLYPRAVELVRAPLNVTGGETPPPPVGAVAAARGGGVGAWSPRPSDGPWHVVVWCSGAAATVDRQARDAAAWSREGGATAVERLQGDAHSAIWTAIREFGRGGGVTLVKLTCLPSAVAALVESVDQESGDTPNVIAHVGNGILYVVLPADALVAMLQALTRQVTTRFSGAAVIEDTPLETKRHVDVWGPTRGDFGLMQSLKREFDPQSTLNPGRFVGRI